MILHVYIFGAPQMVEKLYRIIVFLRIPSRIGRDFKMNFLKTFIDDKVPTMFLKVLGNLRMEHNEKVKYLNDRFYCILNKFTENMKPHDSITINYYINRGNYTHGTYIEGI